MRRPDLARVRRALREPPGRYRRWFALYTALFLLILCCAYYPFWVTGTSLLWGGADLGDGVRQHYTAFVYLGRWGRKLLRGLLTGRGVPTWDFSLGYGADILTTLHYYGLGDPFNLISLLTPMAAAEYVLCALIPVRLYLAGVFFSRFCFRFGKGRAATLCAALSYVFCGYALYAGVRHPFFLNPMVWFPLLLLGTERVLRREGPGLLILAVFLSAASSFYFFYQLVIFTVLYTLLRCASLGWLKRPRELGGAALRMAAFSLIGTAMAGVILLPVLIAFLGDSRLGSDYAWSLFYQPEYYQRLLGAFLTNDGSGSWTYLCLTPGTLLSVCLLFLRRGRRELKAAFLLLTAFLIFPACGRALNGLSYPTNRWCWAYAFLCCYLLADLWPELLSATRRTRQALACFTAALAVLAMLLPPSRTANVFLALLLMCAVLLVLSPSGSDGRFRASGALLAITALSVTASAFYCFHWSEGNLVGERLPLGQAQTAVTRTEDPAVRQTAADRGEKGFYRYTVCPALSGQANLNSAPLSGLYSTKYYWSLSNGNVARFLLELNNLEYSTYRFTGPDDRAGPLALGAVAYWAVPARGHQNRYLPYGYELAGFGSADPTGTPYSVFRNRYRLPLGYTYDRWMSRRAYEALSPTEKEEALLQRAVLDENTQLLPEEAPELEQKELSWQITCGEGADWTGDAFRVTQAGAAVTLTFSGLPDSQTCLRFEGLTCADRQRSTFTVELACDEVKKTLTSHTDSYTWYNNRTDFVVNLGWRETAPGPVTLTFPKSGVYPCGGLHLTCQPMGSYAARVAALAAHPLKKVRLSDNRVSGTVELDRPGLLCLSIPCSSGWTARVDGTPARLLRTNTMYMGLALPAGDHAVELRYATPGLGTGALLSVGGLLAFAGALFLPRKPRKERP